MHGQQDHQQRSRNQVVRCGVVVSLLKVIQSDEDGEASWSSMTITHLVFNSFFI